jgi:hypothetical protein
LTQNFGGLRWIAKEVRPSSFNVSTSGLPQRF